MLGEGGGHGRPVVPSSGVTTVLGRWPTANNLSHALCCALACSALRKLRGVSTPCGFQRDASAISGGGSDSGRIVAARMAPPVQHGAIASFGCRRPLHVWGGAPHTWGACATCASMFTGGRWPAFAVCVLLTLGAPIRLHGAYPPGPASAQSRGGLGLGFGFYTREA